MRSITRSSIVALALVWLALPRVYLGAQDISSILAGIRARGELRVACLAGEIFPFTFHSGGTLKGFDIDLADRIAKAIGVRLSIDASYPSEPALIEALNGGRADIGISRLKRSLVHSLSISYSRPYLTLEYALVSNRLALARKRLDDQSLAALRAHQVLLGTLDVGRYRELAMRLFPLAKVLMYADTAALERAVLSSEIDGAFCDEAEAREMFRGKPERGIALRYYPVAEASDGIVAYLPWKEEALADWVSVALDPVAKVTTFTGILSKYEKE